MLPESSTCTDASVGLYTVGFLKPTQRLRDAEGAIPSQESGQQPLGRSDRVDICLLKRRSALSSDNGEVHFKPVYWLPAISGDASFHGWMVWMMKELPCSTTKLN